MDSKNFRLGNLVFWDIPEKEGKPHLITGLSWCQIKTKPISIGIDDSEYKPIPLTEQWLIIFGFEISYSSNFRLKFDHQKYNEIGFDFSHTPDKSMEGFRYFGHYIKIEYVHQLQNLFFALTGSELQLNEQM